MKHKRSKGAWLTLLVGIALVLTAIVPVLTASDVLVYTALAPSTGEEIESLVKSKETALKNIADALEASAVGARMQGSYVSTEAGGGASAALTGIGEGWFEVYPEFMLSGRRITEAELRDGKPVVMLDEGLAFQLFPTQDPIDKQVSIEGVTLNVVGVVRHTRMIGEAEQYRAFAPLLAVKDARFLTVELAASPLPNSGASIMFATTVRDGWLYGGEYYNMAKESMRCVLPLRLLALLFGIAVLVFALGKVNRFSLLRYAHVRERLEGEYAIRLLPAFAGNAFLLAAMYAVVFGCAYLLAYWSVQPLYVFTEWVPDNMVKWSSILTVFWNLVTQDASLVTVSTPQIRALSFWGGMIRWGTILTLCGALLLALGSFGRKANKEE